MLTRNSDSDVQSTCGTCAIPIFVPRGEWNRKSKRGVPRVFCTRTCAGKKKKVLETRTCKCGATFIVLAYSGKKNCTITCSHQRVRTHEARLASNAKCSTTLKRLAKENPELYMKGFRAANAASHRFSSRAERELAQILVLDGFKRHSHVTVGDTTFDIDIVSADGRVWIESDGEWHFRQVHKGHNFEATKCRDLIEEREALNRNVLLIRVNNQTTTIEKQVSFIRTAVQSWNGVGEVLRLGYE